MPATTNEMKAEWITILKSSGIKLTGPRYSVVEILADSEKALTAAEIFHQAHNRYPSLGLVSVYRALEKLEWLGLVQRVHQKDNCQAYIAAPVGHEHLLVCSSCGRVSFFAGDDLLSLIGKVEKETGYVIQEHWLQLLGLCAQCRTTGRVPRGHTHNA